jgi:hypothetical protein
MGVGVVLLSMGLPAAFSAPIGTVSWRNLTVSSSGLSVAVNNLPAAVEWVVAIKVQTGNDRFGAEIGSATLSVPIVGAIRQLIDISDLPASAYTLGPGSLAVDGTRADKNGLLIYAVVPQGTPVRVAANGATLSDAVIANSLMIRSGSLIAEPVSSPASALRRLAIPFILAPPPLSTLSNGVTVANNDEARRHALETFKPARISTQSAPSASRRAALGLTISSTGGVTQVQVVSGDSELASQAKASASGWRFTPFVVGGSAVQVTTLVILTADSDGTVHSPFD